MELSQFKKGLHGMAKEIVAEWRDSLQKGRKPLLGFSSSIGQGFEKWNTKGMIDPSDK